MIVGQTGEQVLQGRQSALYVTFCRLHFAAFPVIVVQPRLYSPLLTHDQKTPSGGAMRSLMKETYSTRRLSGSPD